MPSIHAIMLLDVAPKIAEQFRTDPAVAELLDPAVLIRANEEGCIATVVERLQLMEMMSSVEPISGKGVNAPSPDDCPIVVIVMDASGATSYMVHDPRTHADHWPWMGLEDDDES